MYLQHGIERRALYYSYLLSIYGFPLYSSPTYSSWLQQAGMFLLSPVYTIQPVVKLVVNPVWQPGKCLYTRYNRLSNRLYNPVWKPVERTAVHSTRLSNPFDNQLDVCLHDTAGCQPVVQPVVSCKRGFNIVISRSSNYLKFRSSEPNRGFFLSKTELKRFRSFLKETEPKVKINSADPI